MGFSFGSIVRAVFPKKKEGESFTEKVQGRPDPDTRKHIKRTTRAIKRAVKEPDDLPPGDDVPAVREVLNNGP
jgi:hypothetical protein